MRSGVRTATNKSNQVRRKVMATTNNKIGMGKAKLPKTAETAAKAGHKKIRVNFSKLSDSDKKKWVS
jgi:GTP cyclohydrolase III